MATDWLETLRQQGETAKRMGKGVPEALRHPNLTLDQASQIYRLVEKGEQDADRLVDLLNESGANESLVKVAKAIQRIWSTLSVAAADKLREMQGLEPIDFPEDNDS